MVQVPCCRCLQQSAQLLGAPREPPGEGAVLVQCLWEGNKVPMLYPSIKKNLPAGREKINSTCCCCSCTKQKAWEQTRSSSWMGSVQHVLGKRTEVCPMQDECSSQHLEGGRLYLLSFLLFILFY